MLHFRTLLMFMAMAGSTTLFAQTPDKSLEKIRNNYTKENIYIHYDKESYVAGETIWFKAYLTAGVVPSPYSTSLSIELLNDSGRVVSKKILPLLGGAATGNFDLSKNTPQMNYTVRAYTRRMMNFGSDYFYYHQVPVYNPGVAGSRPIQSTFEINFLPEGGNLVAGVSNVIAFKATDKFGNPQECEGQVLDSKGSPVVSFKSVHDGMGKFSFAPIPGETYSASVVHQNQTTKVSFPAAMISGVTLQVQDGDGKKYFIVNKTKVAHADLQPAYVLGVMENTVLFTQDISKATDNIKGTLLTSEMPSGILQLTLFNKNNQPLAERMIFINNKDFLLSGQFATDTISLEARGKNSFSVKISDTVPGSFSVAITDVSKNIPVDSRENIISSLMLSNDIKGTINNPIYYFEANDAERKNNLDLVMMTNGWRRFNWDQILSNRLPAMSYKDENYISFTAKAFQSSKKIPLGRSSLNVFVTTKDSASQFFQADADQNGVVRIPGMIFTDSATIAFQENNGQNKQISMAMSSPGLSSLFTSVPASLAGRVNKLSSENLTTNTNNILREEYGYLLSNDNLKIVSLADVQVNSIRTMKSKTRLVEERYLDGLFANGGAKTIDFINMNERLYYPNIFEYLKGRESSVNVSGSGVDYFVNYRNTRSMMGGLLPMAIYIDGAPANSMYAASIPVREIALVQIRGTFVGAEGGGSGGALAIYTRKGEDLVANSRFAGNLNFMKIEGYSPVKEFFSPDYDKEKYTGTDKRSTLYWDPYVYTQKGQNTIHIPFFNSDQAKKFRVIITGITEEGKMLYIEKIVE